MLLVPGNLHHSKHPIYIFTFATSPMQRDWCMCCAGCNTVSTAEQAVLCILSVVRNYPTAHQQIVNGEWNLAEASSTAYDLEGKHVGYAGN